MMSKGGENVQDDDQDKSPSNESSDEDLHIDPSNLADPDE